MNITIFNLSVLIPRRSFDFKTFFYLLELLMLISDRLQLPKYLENKILKHLGSIFPHLDTLLLPGYNYLTEKAVQNMPKTLTELNLRNIVEIDARHIITITQQCPQLKKIDFFASKISYGCRSLLKI